MTQPAKVQEPSMEDILASIRRIIADDEAKPPVAEKAPNPAPPPTPAAARPEKVSAAAPAPKPVMDKVPPSNTTAAKAAAAKAAAAPPPKPAPAPAATNNNQDDIDALLSGLDEATTEAEIRPSPSEPEVLELTDEMALPNPPTRASFKKVEPQDDLEFAEAAAKPAYRPPAYEPPPFESPTVSQQILSRSTVSAVETAFSSLTNTVMSNNARTLEDLVKDMLRPMLKSWLDDNLPGLVERIVKAEIERVSRGR
jgi:cell pole-organizing protein PopZ